MYRLFQIYGHTTRFPDFRVIVASESSEIRGDSFTDFCVHTARFSGNRLKKVGRLKKIGQWDHGISELEAFFWCFRTENSQIYVIPLQKTKERHHFR